MNHFTHPVDGVSGKDSQQTSLNPDILNSPSGQSRQQQYSLTSASPSRSGPVAAVVTGLLKRLLNYCGNPPVHFVLPDGQIVANDSRVPVGSIRFSDYRTIVRVAFDPIFQFGEAFAENRIQIDGDLAECLTVIYRAMNEQARVTERRRLFDRFRRPRTNSLRRSRDNIHQHYDLGNDFYRLWLDERMLYTCAYFAHNDMTLEQAQLSKMDHVCRKLRLQPGMQVVEAGCGWGALAMHMARHYGVQVKAFNISREQIAWAREAAQQQGLTDRVDFIHDDWRNIKGDFDAFASVGMLEHVGGGNYSRLGQTIHECLKPEGVGLIHSIGQNQPLPFSSWIERRIFPGVYPPTIKQMMDIFEPFNFQVLDIENLRLHYAETIRHWLDRFERSQDVVQEMFDDQFFRTWRLYLAGSTAAFASGWLQLFQVVFVQGTSNNVPRTRAELYQPETPQRVES